MVLIYVIFIFMYNNSEIYRHYFLALFLVKQEEVIYQTYTLLPQEYSRGTSISIQLTYLQLIY